jgi:hypothetical protein
MYECKNRKSDEFWEFGHKNHGKWSSGSKDIGSGNFQGQNSLFRSVLGVILEFWSGWRDLAQETGALAKFGNFCGIFLYFCGPFCKYFSKAEGPVVSFPNAQGMWHNLQQSEEA